GGNTALCIYHCALADGEVFAHTYRSPEYHFVFYDRFAAYAHLRCKKSVLADDSAVAYVYVVVQLAAFAYDGIATDAFVDTATRAYLHIVPYHHAAAAQHLVILHLALFATFEVESIST